MGLCCGCCCWSGRGEWGWRWRGACDGSIVGGGEGAALDELSRCCWPPCSACSSLPTMSPSVSLDLAAVGRLSVS